MAEYYVNGETGNDSYTVAQAQNPATPWLTLNKLKANMVSGDIANLAGVCHEYVIFSSLTGCVWRQWAGQTQFHGTGASTVLSISQIGAYAEATLAGGLTIDHVSYDYYNAAIQDTDGRRKAFLVKRATAASAQGTNYSWHYAGTTLTVRYDGGTVDAAKLEYMLSSILNGFQLTDCTNCEISGLYVSRTGMKDPGANFNGYGIALQNCIGCTTTSCTTLDNGKHGIGAIGDANFNNVFRNCTSICCYPTSTNYIGYSAASRTITANTIASSTVVTVSVAHGLVTGSTVTISGSNSTPVIDGTYTITVLSATTFSIPVTVTVAGTAGTVVSPGIGIIGCRFISCSAIVSPSLAPDGTFPTAAPDDRTPAGMVGFYTHNSVTTGVKDIEFRNCTAKGYGLATCTAFDSADAGTAPTDKLNYLAYKVRYIGCTSINLGIGPGTHTAYVRCRQYFTGTSWTTTSYFRALSGAQVLCDDSVFAYAFGAGGSYPTYVGIPGGGGNDNGRIIFQNCSMNDSTNGGRDRSLCTIDNTTGTIEMYGSGWWKLTGNSVFLIDGFGLSASNFVVSGGWYYNASGTMTYSRVSAETYPTAWPSDAAGIYSNPTLTSDTTNAIPSTTGSLYKTHTSQTNHGPVGYNSIRYSGNYGAYQYSTNNVHRGNGRTNRIRRVNRTTSQ